MFKLSQIAGFDFEKKVVFIKTGKMFFDKPVYEIESLPADEIEAIFDAWLDYKAQKKELGA